MEAHSSFSSSSSSYRLPRNSQSDHHYYHSSLHSVRKPSTKQGNKKSVAPMPPTRPRVYKVDPINFRDLVQKLTGSQPLETVKSHQRLQNIAPPPLDVATPSFLGRDISVEAVAPSPVKTPFSGLCKELMSENDTLDVKRGKMFDSSLGLSLSPSTYNWCAYYPLLSPGTLSGLEQSTAR